MQRLRAPGTPRVAAYLLTFITHEVRRWAGKKPLFRDYHHAELAEECGCSVRTIIRAVQWLHANGKLHVERTGRRNRYHLHAPVEKVEAPLVLLVDNPRSDRSVTSEVTEVSPIEPDENLSNSVPDDTSEAPVSSPKELTKERSLRGGVPPRPPRAKGGTPTPSKASITSQELDELFSNVGETDGVPVPATAEPSPAPLDTFWDETLRRIKRSGDGPPPPRAPRHHHVNAGSASWTFEVLTPGVEVLPLDVLKSRKPRPQEEEKAKHLLDPQPAEYIPMSYEEGCRKFAAVLAELGAKPKNTRENHQTSSEAYHQALERRRRRTRYGEE